MDVNSSSSSVLPRSTELFHAGDPASSHGRRDGGAPRSAWWAQPRRTWTKQTLYKLVTLFAVCTTMLAIYYVNNVFVKSSTLTVTTGLRVVSDVSRQAMVNSSAIMGRTDKVLQTGGRNIAPAKLPNGVPNASPVQLPTGGRNTLPVKLQSGSQNSPPVQLASRGQNTSPVQLPSGGQNTIPAKLPSGGQNALPVQLPSGGQNTSPVQLQRGGQISSTVQLQSGGQNASPVQLPSGGQNTSPVQLQRGGKNASPVQLPSGGQSTSPVQLQSGGQKTLPAKLPSGGQNASPVQLQSGGQRTSPVQLQSGGQNTSPAKLPTGGQNPSPVQLPTRGQNASPVQLQSGGQNTSPAKLPTGGQNPSPVHLPTRGQNASPVQLPSGRQNTSPAKLPIGGQNTSPVQLQSGGQNTSPAKLPTGGQNPSPVQLPTGGQNASPVQLQSGGQNTSPAKLPTGGQNPSPVHLPTGGQNASPVQLPSGGQSTPRVHSQTGGQNTLPAKLASQDQRALPANPSEGPKSLQMTADSSKTCPELQNVPNLNGAAEVLHLEETPMDTVESLFFGDMRDKILHLVAESNRQMMAPLLQTPSTGGTGLLGSLSRFEATVGSYSYLPGGHWRPTHCTPRWKVAIIVPYRHREYHLPILIRHLVPMLQRQLLQFAIYAVNQENELPFNRAMLMNVGFLESLKFTDWDCFVLHDVDHIPLNDQNDYGCANMPKRMISGADRWNYRVPYHNFFGAVTGLTRENIRTINGFPNVYWGWGGEDDEIFERLRARNLNIIRTSGPTNHYKTISHHHIRAEPMKERIQLLRTFRSRYEHDGLNNLKYPSPHIELHTTYTNISVNIHKL